MFIFIHKFQNLSKFKEMTLTLNSLIFLEKMMIRKSYSIKYKLSVLRYVDQTSPNHACRTFHLSPSMISRWRRQEHSLLSIDTKRCHLPGAGRPLSFPDEELELSNWINETRSCRYPIAHSDVRETMLNLVHDKTQSFKASNGWLC